jgi:glycine C-acetyltransferase
VAKTQARIRTQLLAAHEQHHLDKGIAAFKKVGARYGILDLNKQQIIEKYGM